METNETSMIMYSGITFNDPTGDISRIKDCINSLCDMVDNMHIAWEAAAHINNIDIRQYLMMQLRELLDITMASINKADRLVTDSIAIKKEDRHA